MNQRDKLLRAKISLALANNLHRQPKPEEVDRYLLAAKVLFESIVGTRMAERRMKENGQQPIF